MNFLTKFLFDKKYYERKINYYKVLLTMKWSNEILILLYNKYVSGF